MHYFKELKVWQSSMNLAVEVYELLKMMPKDETYGLTSQIRRCVVAIPSNIAEGAGRNTDADFSRFLDMSSGSTNELETQLLLSVKLGYVKHSQVEPLLDSIYSIQKMIFKLLESLRRKEDRDLKRK